MSQSGNKNDQAKLLDKSFPCCYAQTIEQHRQNLNDIVDLHLNEAKNRVTPIYWKHFASPSVVLSRHWRHRGDIPKELVTLPRSAWGFIKSVTSVKKNQPEQKLNSILYRVSNLNYIPRLKSSCLIYKVWTKSFKIMSLIIKLISMPN